MKSFNLARWAIRHKSIIYFFVAVILFAGTYSYYDLGRREDPEFTIRQMIVTAVWPGASAEQMTEQVTDKLEEKLQDTPNLDWLRSYTRGDVSIIYVSLDENMPVETVRPTWTEVRNLVEEVWPQLPPGVVGPIFNDRFDDVYGSIYALTGDAFSFEEKRVYAEKMRRHLLQVPDVQKVKLLGVQEETIFIEMDENKLAQLKIDPRLVFQVLNQQGSLMPAGVIRTDTHNIALRVEGLLEDVNSIRNLTIHLGERSFRIGDIADVYMGYEDPPSTMVYFNGKPAVGIAISMKPGGNVLKLGDNLSNEIDFWEKELPLGLEIGQVTNQPEVVNASIKDFTNSLFEAIAIVMIVSFAALGWRSGAVVALCIPVVVGSTFIFMNYLDIDLQIVSLGALIISLGLLVDDAMIVIEMMQRKLEEGQSRIDAASAAYELTAFPMLSGTLITAAGFIPIGIARGMVAEYTHSLFSVTAIALLISWVASVLVSPVLGYEMIKVKTEEEKKNSWWTNLNRKLFAWFHVLLEKTLRWRKTVVIATIALFVVALFTYPLLNKEFFPASVRPELIVEMELPFGSSLKSTQDEVLRFESHLYGDERIESITSYIGESAPRFILPFEPIPPKDNFAQIVVKAIDAPNRVELHKEVQNLLAEEFPDVRANIRLIQTGPPAEYPVMLRLTGPDAKTLYEQAQKVIAVMDEDPEIRLANMNWPQETPIMQVHIDQNKVRMLGIDNYAVSADLYTKLSGYKVTSVYQGDRLIPVKFRLPDHGADRLAELINLPIHIGNGRYVPLGQFADLEFAVENNTIWRENLMPSIILRADTIGNLPGDTVTENLYENNLKEFRENLPPGYELKYEGSTERSHISIESIVVVTPVMIFFILAVLMFQLQKIRLMFMAVMTAPLGLIGSITMLQITRRPIGFVAVLGIIALAGMIIRNSIILLDQIEQHRAIGQNVWDAIIDSALLRFRPIMLTAMAAILGMIPLMRSHFWGPMAFAFSGGLLVATLLTLVFLPALYAWVYKADEAESEHTGPKGTTAIDPGRV